LWKHPPAAVPTTAAAEGPPASIRGAAIGAPCCHPTGEPASRRTGLHRQRRRSTRDKASETPASDINARPTSGEALRERWPAPLIPQHRGRALARPRVPCVVRLEVSWRENRSPGCARRVGGPAPPPPSGWVGGGRRSLAAPCRGSDVPDSSPLAVSDARGPFPAAECRCATENCDFDKWHSGDEARATTRSGVSRDPFQPAGAITASFGLIASRCFRLADQTNPLRGVALMASQWSGGFLEMAPPGPSRPGKAVIPGIAASQWVWHTDAGVRLVESPSPALTRAFGGSEHHDREERGRSQRRRPLRIAARSPEMARSRRHHWRDGPPEKHLQGHLLAPSLVEVLWKL